MPQLITVAALEMVEVGGIEPPSKIASPRCLRAYPTYSLAPGRPIGGLGLALTLMMVQARVPEGSVHGRAC